MVLCYTPRAMTQPNDYYTARCTDCHCFTYPHLWPFLVSMCPGCYRKYKATFQSA